MDFKVFEELATVRDSYGLLRKSASVKRWETIGVGRSGDGYGVYALDDINDNTLIEECPVIEVPVDEVKGSVLMDYLFKTSQDLYVLALGNGSIYNHRNQPNARWEYIPEQKIIKIVSSRPIKSGEEIFISYGREYFRTRGVNMKA
jgi:SET domain-containing protein